MSLRHLFQAGCAAALGMSRLTWLASLCSLGILTGPMAYAAPPATSTEAQSAKPASGPGIVPKQPARPPGAAAPADPDNMPVKRPQPSQSNDPISRTPPASAANAK